MSEKLDKLRASLEKEKERRIKINNRMRLRIICSASPTMAERSVWMSV